MRSSASFAPSIARLRRGSGQIPLRSGVGLACKLAVVFDSRRAVDVVAKH